MWDLCRGLFLASPLKQDLIDWSNLLPSEGQGLKTDGLRQTLEFLRSYFKELELFAQLLHPGFSTICPRIHFSWSLEAIHCQQAIQEAPLNAWSGSQSYLCSHRTQKMCLPASSASCYRLLTRWLCCCTVFVSVVTVWSACDYLSFLSLHENYFWQLTLKPSHYRQIEI